MDLLAAARQVRLLAMDIDGTLTDGSIWIGPQGECAKRFSVRDGFGIKLLQKAGIELAIITGRRSEIVARAPRNWASAMSSRTCPTSWSC